MKLGNNPSKRCSNLAKAAAIALIAASAGGVEAGTLKFIDAGGGYRDLGQGGGEFQMNILSATAGNTAEQNLLANWAANYSSKATIDADGAGSIAKGFGTYCLEYGEHFNFNTTYNYVISDSAKNGGPDYVGAPNDNMDKISMGTARLYSLFALGQLDGFVNGYDYTAGAGRAAAAAALQEAFWMLENEINPADWNNRFLAILLGINNDQNYWRADANGAFGVAVLNITDSAGGKMQDQLVYLGNDGSSTNVPDGGSTAILLGLSALGIAATRRWFLRIA